MQLLGTAHSGEGQMRLKCGCESEEEAGGWNPTMQVDRVKLVLTSECLRRHAHGSARMASKG